MSCLVLLVLSLSSWQYVVGQPQCTKTDLCNIVNATTCNNSLCMKVTLDDIHQIFSTVATIHDWNILRPPFTNRCPFEVTYVPISSTEVNTTFSTFTGPNCTGSQVFLSRVFTSDIDPSTSIGLLTAVIGGETVEDCFIYLEDGVGLVYRRCIIDNSTESCAAIYSIEDLCQDNSKIHTFLDNLGVNMTETVAVCVA